MSKTVDYRAIGSWTLWDWGSASFNAVIVTFVFAPYLTSGVAATEEAGSQALGWSTAAAGLVIALVAPAAGTRADASGRHRFWLGFHTFVVVGCMAAMFFAGCLSASHVSGRRGFTRALALSASFIHSCHSVPRVASFNISNRLSFVI